MNINRPIEPLKKYWKPKKFAEWMSRWVLWAKRDGVYHVALNASIVGAGVVARLACGGATGMGIEATTYCGQKHNGHRVCRKCAKILEAAGKSGMISR